jgi:hypothetical protein
MHGQYIGNMDRQLIIEEGTFLWLTKGDLKAETEREIIILIIIVIIIIIIIMCSFFCRLGSSVGIATEPRAGRSGDRIPLGARFSAPVQSEPEAQPASCTMVKGYFPGLENGQGVTLTPHPLLVPRSKNRVGLYLYSP